MGAAACACCSTRTEKDARRHREDCRTMLGMAVLKEFGSLNDAQSFGCVAEALGKCRVYPTSDVNLLGVPLPRDYFLSQYTILTTPPELLLRLSDRTHSRNRTQRLSYLHCADIRLAVEHETAH